MTWQKKARLKQQKFLKDTTYTLNIADFAVKTQSLANVACVKGYLVNCLERYSNRGNHHDMEKVRSYKIALENGILKSQYKRIPIADDLQRGIRDTWVEAPRYLIRQSAIAGLRQLGYGPRADSRTSMRRLGHGSEPITRARGDISLSQALNTIPHIDGNPDMLPLFCKSVRFVLEEFGRDYDF